MLDFEHLPSPLSNALCQWMCQTYKIKTSGMLDGHRTGDVLMTVATGPLSKEECGRTGLVECHAYAVSIDCLFVCFCSPFCLIGKRK